MGQTKKLVMLYSKNLFSPLGIHSLTLFLVVGALFASTGIFAQANNNNQNTNNNSSFTVGVTAQVPCSCRPPDLSSVICGLHYASPFTFTLSATGGLDLTLTTMSGTAVDPLGNQITPTSVAFHREVVTYQNINSGKGNAGSAAAPPIPTYSWVPLTLPYTIPANGTIKIKATIFFVFCDDPDPLGTASIPTGHYVFTANFSGTDENGEDFAGFAEHIFHIDYGNDHLREASFTSASNSSWFPNPSGEYAQLTFSQATEGQVSLQIMDMQGKEISEKSQRMYAHRGENKIKVSLTSLPPGIYFAKLSGPQGVEIIQWVKL